ncbi:MAG: hypothetical protein H6686_09550 [Fibrobacteria bacterium]|nr:hypothetical protein [Fibrobacteria bacterium]
MKSPLLATAAVLAAAPSSHALFGLGFSYGRNTSSVSSSTETVSAGLPTYLADYAVANGITAGTLVIDRAALDGLQQLGVKTWLDLPLIPVEFEAGANVAWGSYKSKVLFDDPTGTHSLEVKTGLDTPVPVWGIGDGETPYVSTSLDASVRYPFLTLPPLSPLKPFKLYAGGGVSWFYASKVVSKNDVVDMFNISGGTTTDKAAAEAALSSKLKDDFYESSFGGHLLLGAQFKLPVVPLAFYADGKWYFNAATSDAATDMPLAVSVGAAFAL